MTKISIQEKILGAYLRRRKTEMTFEVIDRNTGKPTDLNVIRSQIIRCQHAGRNFWAEHLIYCDLAEWVISEDGVLALTDDCGNIAYPPSKRYYPVFHQEEGDNIQSP